MTSCSLPFGDKAGKMPANMSFFHAGGIYGKYRHLLENTGKYKKNEFTTLELKQKTKPYTQHLYMNKINNRG